MTLKEFLKQNSIAILATILAIVAIIISQTNSDKTQKTATQTATLLAEMSNKHCPDWNLVCKARWGVMAPVLNLMNKGWMAVAKHIPPCTTCSPPGRRGRGGSGGSR